MLQLEPSKRITLKVALKHPFFTGSGYCPYSGSLPCLSPVKTSGKKGRNREIINPFAQGHHLKFYPTQSFETYLQGQGLETVEENENKLGVAFGAHLVDEDEFEAAKYGGHEMLL